MCGQVGIAGRLTGHRNLFSSLLLVDHLRGEDGTGVAACKPGKSEVVKAAASAEFMIGTKAYNNVVYSDTETTVALIGHNRFATMGKVIAANSHPFKSRNIVGAHNGTITDKPSLQRLGHDDTMTDSEALIRTIQREGGANVLTELWGAWSLVWFDTSDTTLHMVRNSQRPLHFALIDHDKTLVWSSDSDILKIVLSYKLKHVPKISMLPEDEELVWHLEDVNDKDFKLKEPDKIDRKRPFKPSKPYSWDYSWDPDTTTYVPRKPETTTVVQLSSKFKLPGLLEEPVDTSKFAPPYRRQDGSILSRCDFETLVRTGCCYCNAKDSRFGDFIYPLSAHGQTSFLCEGCYNDAETRQITAQYMAS